MNRTITVPLGILALFMIGCIGPGPVPPKYEIAGVVGASRKDPTKYAFVDLATTTADGHSLGHPLHPSQKGSSGEPGEVLSTDKIVRIDVFQPAIGPHPTYNYHALLGPEFVPGSTAIGRLHTTDPVLYLGQGWVFAWGDRAISASDWVKAAADATDMAVQIVNTSVHRVFFLGPVNHNVKIYCCKDYSNGECNGYFTTQLVTLDTPGTYVDIGWDNASQQCSLLTNPPATIAGNADASAFIANVKSIACEAHWPDPSCPP